MKLTLRQTELLTFLKSDPRNFLFYKSTGSTAHRPFMCYVVIHRSTDGGHSVVPVDYRTADSLADKKLIHQKKLKKLIDVQHDGFRYGSHYVQKVWVLS